VSTVFARQLRERTASVWDAVHAHPFVTGIGDGTLPTEVFTFYLAQDHAYLDGFARVLAVAAAKAESLDDMRRLGGLLALTLEEEMEMHRRTCAAFGITSDELERTEPGLVTSAYTSYLLRTCYEGSMSDILAVLLPCAAGYVEIAQRLRELEQDYIKQYIGLTAVEDTEPRGPGGAGGFRDERAPRGEAATGLDRLTPQQAEELREEKRTLLLDAIRDRASEIHIYAQTDPTQADFPFARNQELLTTTAPPKPELLWEAQLELWVMQDIVSAIGEVNQVDNPDASVALAPVKRLLGIEVLPGYVGIHTQGAMGSGGSGGRSDSYAPPAHNIPNDPDRPLPAAFHYTPTGRISNALYDVRHARVRAVIDYRLLPDIVNGMSHNNFMTVLNVEVENIDEFAALREGYFYGSGDCVEATLLIESLWLRSWTVPLMPPRVRTYLQVEEDRRLVSRPPRRPSPLPPRPPRVREIG
jgi:thiaminase II